MPPSLSVPWQSCLQRGASEPQLRAILLNPLPLSPSPLKVENNGLGGRRRPEGFGEKVSGSGPGVLCKPTQDLRPLCHGRLCGLQLWLSETSLGQDARPQSQSPEGH